MHDEIQALSSRLDDVGGPGWFLLQPLLVRKRGRKKRYDGFTAGGYSVDDLQRRMYSRIWLVGQILTSCGCDNLSPTHALSTKQTKRLNTDIVKHIVGFTGIDGILRQSTTLRKYEPLFSTLVERNLVLRRHGDFDRMTKPNQNW
jgi:hypothetical protein